MPSESTGLRSRPTTGNGQETAKQREGESGQRKKCQNKKDKRKFLNSFIRVIMG